MDKRGQIFIFAAIVVALVTFMLFTKPNTMREEILLENFGEISENYLNEAPKVIDNSLYNEFLVEQNLEKYTGSFLNYARNQLDPNVGIVYIYTNGTSLIVDNHLKDELISFTSLSEPDIKIFSKGEPLEGGFILEGTGINNKAFADLCATIDPQLGEKDVPYCIININTDPAQDNNIKLKIGDNDYYFDIGSKNPSMVVIIKSSKGETTKVDVSETIIQSA